jgi:undecaprenyl-diphosphatase
MIEMLKQWDQDLLLKINKDWANPFFDWLMPIITDLHHTWQFKFIFVPAFILLFIYKKKYRGALFCLLLILALGFGDILGGKIIKPFFERARPPVAGIEVIVRGGFGSFSFPSNHALNIFTAATFISLSYPIWSGLLFSYALLIAYSRPYCGVHFPSDVIAGAFIGFCIGYIFYFIYQGLQKKWLKS